jgi:hypothetical protein
VLAASPGAVELTHDDLRDIENAASKITVQGARYPEGLEQMTGRRAARNVFSGFTTASENSENQILFMSR